MSRVSGKKSGTVSKAGIIFKAILLAVMLLGLFVLGAAVIGSAQYGSDRSVNAAGQLNWLEKDYLDKDYGEIYERLSRFKLTSEAFDEYWEISEAALALENLKLWHRAEKKGVDGSEEKIEYYYNEVLTYAQNCKFERNRAELERFVAEAGDIVEETYAP